MVGSLTNGGPVTVVFAGGGSGGHIYPALAVAYELRSRLDSMRLVFLGTNRSVEHRILDGVDCEFVPQDLTGASSAPWRWPGMLWRIRQSTARCRERFRTLTPSVVIGTGGMASVPAIREAHRLGVPTALFNPDAVPGRANRHLCTRADVVFVQWEDTVAAFPAETRVEVTGCPVRASFNQANREKGFTRFKLDRNLKTLVITGASQGAHSVNEAVIEIADRVLRSVGWQILHLTGEADHPTVRQRYESLSLPAVAIDYTDDMADALALADLVVSRAGASTLAELTAVGRASVLMPYPYHRDEHQTANARCLVRAGAARIVKDNVDVEVNAPALWAALEPLLSDDHARTAMADAAHRIGRGNAALRIADSLIELMTARQAARSGETMETVRS